MPRQRRKESSTGVYHVIAKGINRERIFNQPREKSYLKRILREFLSNYNVEIYAYCIMSNHVHLIIKSELQELSMYMAICLAKYAEYYNYKHKRNGHVFQNRFKSECIETSQYFWNCVRYIHLNPLKANQIKNIEDYKYSSLGEYKKMSSQILHENAFGVFNERFEDWEDFINFHYKSPRQIFDDVKEDKERHQREVAMIYLTEMQQELNIEKTEQIMEERELREQFKNYLRENLKVSIRRCNKIVSEIQEVL